MKIIQTQTVWRQKENMRFYSIDVFFYQWFNDQNFS